MKSDDPEMVLKRRIRSIKSECGQTDLPPWKKELLQKRIENLTEELKQLQLERANQIEEKEASKNNIL